MFIDWHNISFVKNDNLYWLAWYIFCEAWQYLSIGIIYPLWRMTMFTDWHDISIVKNINVCKMLWCVFWRNFSVLSGVYISFSVLFGVWSNSTDNLFMSEVISLMIYLVSEVISLMIDLVSEVISLMILLVSEVISVFYFGV